MGATTPYGKGEAEVSPKGSPDVALAVEDALAAARLDATVGRVSA